MTPHHDPEGRNITGKDDDDDVELDDVDEVEVDEVEVDEVEVDDDDRYFGVREGEFSHFINGHPKRVIAQGDHFIVYLSLDNRTRVVADEYPDGFGEIANLVVDLEAAPTNHLSDEQVTALRSFGAHALVRCVDEEDFDSARSAVERGWRYYNARSSEVSRQWYLIASFQGLGMLVVAALACQLASTGAGMLCYAALCGGLGAFISIVIRLGGVCPDPSGGRTLHRLESWARLAVGCLSGFTFALALLGGVALNVLKLGEGAVDQVSLYFCMFVAVLSGTSERAIPELVSSNKLG